MSVDYSYPTPDSFQEENPYAVDRFGKSRNRLDRLEQHPDSLSLEMIASLVENLSSYLSELPPESSSKLRIYLDFICFFIRETKDQCVEANQRLVLSTIQNQFFVRLKTKGIDFEDAAQEGNIGLMIAALLYDPSRKYAFSTYAVWWIHCFLRKILSCSTLIHIPPYLDTLHYSRVINKSKQLNERRTLPSGYHEKWQDARKVRFVRSINTCESEWNGSKEIPKVEQEDHIETIDCKLDLEALLEHLDPLGRRIIELRSLQNHSLKEVARVLFREGLTATRITKERVRQKEKKALEDLKEKAKLLLEKEQKKELERERKEKKSA